LIAGSVDPLQSPASTSTLMSMLDPVGRRHRRNPGVASTLTVSYPSLPSASRLSGLWGAQACFAWAGDTPIWLCCCDASFTVIQLDPWWNSVVLLGWTIVSVSVGLVNWTVRWCYTWDWYVSLN
jgi:hypothetical protein